MDHIRLALLSLLVIFGLGTAAVHGQPNTSAQTTNAALREKAFEVIDSVASQIGTLQSGENRARFGSNIADALWQRDEKRARALFISIEEDINAGLRNADDDQHVRSETRMVFYNLRINTVGRIAKHDPEFALSFLKATELTEDASQPTGFTYGDRLLTLNLAQQIAADNPDLALKLARESFQDGFPNELLPVLKKLNKNHREQAMTLYGDIIERLKNLDLLRESWAFYFALNLARSFTPPMADVTSVRQLISVFKASAQAHDCASKKKSDDERRSWFCNQIESMVSQMERTGVGGSKQADAGERVPQWLIGADEEIIDLMENGTIDELLTLPNKYPYLKDEVYERAIMKAEASGDGERAKKIATDYDGNPDTKQRMLKRIERNQMWASMNDEKMAELQKTLSKFPRTPDRIHFLASAAGQIGGSDRKTALKLLDQANQLVETMKPGTDQTDAQLTMSIMYCSEKSDRGLAIMEPLIPKLNELIAATAKLDGYDHYNLRDGEWNMSGQGSVGSLLTALARNAAYFAWCDFERAVSLTSQFERTEIRLMAQLKLAQGILAGQPPRIRLPAPPY
jgi:hypothetical protein